MLERNRPLLQPHSLFPLRLKATTTYGWHLCQALWLFVVVFSLCINVQLPYSTNCIAPMNYISAHIPARVYEWIALILFFFCGIFFIRNATENTLNWCIEWFIIGKLCSGYMYYFKSPKWTKLCSIEWIKNFMVISFYRSSVMYLNPFRCSAWKHFNAFMEKTEIR